MQNAMLSPGFAQPVEDANRTFRQAMAALSEPGTLHEMADTPTVQGLCTAAYALCLGLLDADTPLWISPALDGRAVRANLAFHCGCPIVQTPAQAQFALVTSNDLDVLRSLDTGTDRDPHLSCTVFMQLNSLDGGVETTWQGPGIQGTRTVALPLPQTFWRVRSLAAFPRGLDFFFMAGRQLSALPRSTRVLRPIPEDR